MEKTQVQLTGEFADLLAFICSTYMLVNAEGELEEIDDSDFFVASAVAAVVNGIDLWLILGDGRFYLRQGQDLDAAETTLETLQQHFGIRTEKIIPKIPNIIESAPSLGEPEVVVHRIGHDGVSLVDQVEAYNKTAPSVYLGCAAIEYILGLDAEISTTDLKKLLSNPTTIFIVEQKGKTIHIVEVERG